jgi:hypothetical protein
LRASLVIATTATLVAGWLALATTSSASAETSQARIGIVTPFELLSPNEANYSGTVTFSISEGTRSELSLELLDVWSAEDGQRTTLPLGSTPTTGENRLAWSLSSVSYTPNGKTQLVQVSLEIPSDALMRAPLSAAVRLTVRPITDSDEPAAVGIIASAIAFVFATHEDFSDSGGDFTPVIKNSDFMISYLSESTSSTQRRARLFIEGELPLASFETKNEGSLFAFVSHELTIRKSGFWIDPLSEEAVVYQTKIEQSIITPGQSRTREIPLTAQLVGTDRVISRLADWGIYDLILKTSHHSGQPDAVDQFESITVVVFPFRQLILLIIVIALAVVLALGARARNRLRETALQGAASGGAATKVS